MKSVNSLSLVVALTALFAILLGKPNTEPTYVYVQAQPFEVPEQAENPVLTNKDLDLLLVFPVPKARVSTFQMPSQEELDCLAKTIYGEARGEGFVGQVLVAVVAFNRALDPRWPASLCKVVKAKAQFAGYWASPPIPKKKCATWRRAYEAAEYAIKFREYMPVYLTKIYYFNGIRENSSFHRKLPLLVGFEGHNFYGDPV